MAHNLATSPKRREIYIEDGPTSSYQLLYANPHALDLSLLVDQVNPILEFQFDQSNPYTSILGGNTAAPITGITGFDEFANLLFESLPPIEIDTTPDWIPAPYTPTFNDGNFSEALFEIVDNPSAGVFHMKKPSLAYTAHKHLQQFSTSTSGGTNRHTPVELQKNAVKHDKHHVQVPPQSHTLHQNTAYLPTFSNYLGNGLVVNSNLQSTSLPNSSKIQNHSFENVHPVYLVPVQLLLQHQQAILQVPHHVAPHVAQLIPSHSHSQSQSQLQLQLQTVAPNIQIPNHHPHHFHPQHHQVFSTHSQTLPASTSPLVAQYNALDLNLPMYPPRQFRNDLDLLYSLGQLDLPLRNKKSSRNLVKKTSMSDTQKPKKHTRKRLLPRLKNGCWICRIKHLKCDETKPTCKLCEKFGIHCDYSSEKPDYVSDKDRRNEKLAELTAIRKPLILLKKRSQKNLT